MNPNAGKGNPLPPSTLTCASPGGGLKTDSEDEEAEKTEKFGSVETAVWWPFGGCMAVSGLATRSPLNSGVAGELVAGGGGCWGYCATGAYCFGADPCSCCCCCAVGGVLV